MDGAEPMGETGTASAAAHGYRPDIDGLRALAVIPVVLNHIGVRGFHGGYVGVDIFFVISGFLITGILVDDLAAGQHSIARFYRRRVLRIFPALFAVLAAVTAISCVTMLPGELIRYARSLAATTWFGSNILFYSETSYFAPASDIKPLLHTWSLAIEEQFYILWPLLLAAIGPARRALLRLTIVAVTIASFAAALAMVAGDKSAAFFLLPARAWELSLGALLATSAVTIKRRWLNELLGVAGVCMILYCIKAYSETTPFPGAGALLPCVGAALLLLTGASGTLVGRLLSLGPAVFVGRISYSLYLWHWPVIVMATIALFLPATPAVMAAEAAVSLALAWLSWRFIEQPFRRGVSGWRTPRVLIGGAAAIAVALVIAFGIIAAGGAAWRFTPRQLAVGAYEDLDGDRLYRSGTCFAVGPHDKFDAAHCLARGDVAKPALVVLGDSHAAHLWPGLALQRARFDVLQATKAGCKPVLYPASERGTCQRFFRDMLGRWLPAHPPDVLLLAARWRESDLTLLEKTLADPRVRAAHPVLIGPIPQYATSLARLLVFANRRGDPALPERALDREVFATDRRMRAIAARHGVPYVSLVAALCRKGPDCREWAAPGIPLQFDYGHLTAEGSAAVVQAIMPQIARAAAHPAG